MKTPMPEEEIAQRLQNIEQYNHQMIDTPHHVGEHEIACLLAEWRCLPAPVLQPMSQEELSERIANARK